NARPGVISRTSAALVSIHAVSPALGAPITVSTSYLPHLPARRLRDFGPANEGCSFGVSSVTLRCFTYVNGSRRHVSSVLPPPDLLVTARCEVAAPGGDRRRARRLSGLLDATGRQGSTEQRVHERRRLERSQIVGALAETDEFDRYPQFVLDLEDDPALRGAVQLRQYHTADIDHLGEDPGLPGPVLTDGRVQHQQHLVHRGLLLHHPFHLAELVHQPGLGVQTAGGIDEYRVHTGVDTGGHRVEGHRCGIGAL